MIIADTGFWLALANPRDNFHERAVEILKTPNLELITTWPVMTETCHLLLNRMGTKAMLAFVAAYRDGAFRVFEMKDDDAGKIHELMVKYIDLPMDLADSTLIILAEHLGQGTILSTDQRDFRTYKWKQTKPFRNLLLPEAK